MTADRMAFGELGERVAERWMKRQGWRGLARRGTEFGEPVEAVGWRKKRELTRSALIWIDRHGRPHETYRFDVIGVLVEQERVRIRHVENAFSVRVSR